MLINFLCVVEKDGWEGTPVLVVLFFPGIISRLNHFLPTDEPPFYLCHYPEYGFQIFNASLKGFKVVSQLDTNKWIK